MEYVFLAAACICFSMQFIFSKLFQQRTDGTIHASMWSSILSGLSMFAIVFIMNGFKIGFNWPSAALASLYALCSIVCTGASLIGMASTSVAVISLYTLLGGVVLPFFYGILFLGEKPSPFRWTGAALLVLAAVVPYVINLSSAKKTGVQKSQPEEKEKTGPKGKLKAGICCAIVFITNGLISIATSAATRIDEPIGSNDFLLLGTLIRIVCSAVILVPLILKKRSRSPLPVDPRTNSAVGLKAFLILFMFSFFYAVLNGAGNIFSLKCAATMDASLQFPIISAACIIFTALIGLVCFREKPSKGDLAGIGLAIAGIVFTIF